MSRTAHRRFNRKFSPQLCGNWDLGRELSDMDIEERRKKQFQSAKVKVANRQKVLKPYCDGICDIFRGSGAEEEVRAVVAKWEIHKYNKELIHAARELKNVLTMKPLDYRFVLKYNIMLKLYCRDNNITCYDELKL